MAKSVSKIHNNSEGDEEKVILRDMISDLPDSLLHHILSFLSTKEAASISLLSKRWNSLWLSQPTLDFNDEIFSSLQSFVHFVNSVINILKDSSNPITKFRIKYSGHHYLPMPTKKFEVWVKSALNLRVQTLVLCFPDWYVVNLPSSIFVCNTIRVLKLHGAGLGNISSVDLPSLKVLHLRQVHFPCFTCFSLVLSRCLLLEELVLSRISTSDYDHNIGLLQHLTRFDDVPYLVTTYEIPSFYYLTHLEISMLHPLDIILKWLQNCPKLQVLEIERVKEERSTLDDDDDGDVLKCELSSHLKEVHLHDFHGSKSEYQFVRLIMKNAICLKTFSIGINNSSFSSAIGNLSELSSFVSRGLRIICEPMR